MNPHLYAIIEPLIIGLIIGVSVVLAVRKVTPRLSDRFAHVLKQGGMPGFVSALFETGATACGSGCGSCSSCGTSSQNQPVILHRSNH
jgi:hypothetical protein